MKFTQEFASHLSVAEYIHYLELGLIQGDIPPAVLGILQCVNEELDDAKKDADDWEAQKADYEKAEAEAEEEKKALEKTLAQVVHVSDEVDNMLTAAWHIRTDPVAVERALNDVWHKIDNSRRDVQMALL
jgi:hypothetical protein